jgi:glycosyltransferase involved in cell wall biosynthesis
LSGEKSRDNLRFISVGNLKPGKNMEGLVSAFAEAHKYAPGITLDIYGEGDSRGDIEAIIAENSLESSVTLHGQVLRSELAQAYSNSGCFILLSKSETFGVAYIEAMASGLPVIATKCGGPEDFVNRNNGILIDNFDQNQAAKAMLYMTQNIGEYDPASISKSIKEKYSDRRIADKLNTLYQDVLNARKAGGRT